MKIKISFLLTAILFFVLTTSVLAASSDFFTKAKKYIDSNCQKSKISDQVSLLCYLFEKSNEQEERINDLEQRIEELEEIITASPSPSPSPQTIYIISDATWKFSLAEVDGWLNANFDDSSWINTQAPSAGQCGQGSIGGTHITENGVLPMSVSDPSWASNTGYFRKTFNLENSPTSSSARVMIDDDGDVYINGHQVLSNHDGTTSGIHQFNIDPSFLNAGENVISIKADDTNGGCQWVETQVTINL